jgi:hypothetical protein
MASMPKEKLDFQLVHMDSFLYVIGGKDSKGNVVNTIERYSLESN